MNLRGAVIPAVDLPLKFGFQGRLSASRTYMVILDLVWSGEAVRLGLLTRSWAA